MTDPDVRQDFEKGRQLAARLHNRAARYHAEGHAVRPERLYLQALEVKQALFGPEHPEVALTLNNLALFYKALGRLTEARPLYERALAIFQKTQGASHDNTASTMFNLARLLKAQSSEMERRARRAEKDAREMADPSRLAEAVIRHDLARFRLRVGPSRIHRFGVFAAESIPVGRKIIPYTGQLLSRRKRVGRGTGLRTYLVRLDPYWCLDGAVGGSGAQLINHCCEPNCRFQIQGHHVWMVSLRKIEADEELLVDYEFSRKIPAIPCYCGTAACRGTMNVRSSAFARREKPRPDDVS